MQSNLFVNGSFTCRYLYCFEYSALLKAFHKAHNHPSGQLCPSDNDAKFTLKIRDAGTLLDITLLDHIILSSEGYYSMADEGLI